MKWKRALACLCGLLLLLLPTEAVLAAEDVDFVPTVASEEGEGLSAITAPSYIVMEQSTGGVALEKEADRLFPPASLAKMMTVLLTLEAVEAGQITAEDLVTASENACETGGVEIWLIPGEQMSVSELLTAISMGSGNDAAVALAEYVCESEEAFVASMNRKAKQLGMTQTTFTDASGYDPNAQTCARDMALLSRALLEHPAASDYATHWMFDLRGGETQLVNTNRLVRFYNGCTGLKTGVSEGSGNCISASATRGELSLVAVAFGVEQTEDSFEDAKKLLDYTFGNFTLFEPELPADSLTPVRIRNGVKEETIPNITGQVTVLIPAGSAERIETEVELSEETEAPVHVGEQLGTVRISLDGKLLEERPILSEEEVERMNFGNAFLIFLRCLLG